MRYECPDCGRPVELEADGEYARNHRRARGLKGKSSWCDGSGRHKRFLNAIEEQS